ncbi:MAG: hypothetical protein KDD70_13775 [Bdellovibrionales bacterium]|nr:hypothetical protein [Bdellovibrionales bacterium]
MQTGETTFQLSSGKASVIGVPKLEVAPGQFFVAEDSGGPIQLWDPKLVVDNAQTASAFFGFDPEQGIYNKLFAREEYSLRQNGTFAMVMGANDNIRIVLFNDSDRKFSFLTMYAKEEGCTLGFLGLDLIFNVKGSLAPQMQARSASGESKVFIDYKVTSAHDLYLGEHAVKTKRVGGSANLRNSCLDSGVVILAPKASGTLEQLKGSELQRLQFDDDEQLPKLTGAAEWPPLVSIGPNDRVLDPSTGNVYTLKLQREKSFTGDDGRRRVVCSSELKDRIDLVR